MADESLKKNFSGPLLFTWLMVPLLVLLDQYAKNTVLKTFYLWESIRVVGNLFRLTRVHNSGAAFGILPDMGHMFYALTIIAIVAVTLHKILTSERSLLYHTGLGLILSGAIGNLIDRVRFGYVIDFLDFGIGRTRWPAFNIADSCITTGVFLILLTAFLSPSRTSLSSGSPDNCSEPSRSSPAKDTDSESPSKAQTPRNPSANSSVPPRGPLLRAGRRGRA
ncbi:MAG: signal peptidase II [Candidatus Hydrogenedentota bacterium]|nr:MAG: signal peptidase II [Candidatus Hydrogenedentota bacterium]